MTDYGYFTAVDADDSFEGKFDAFENPVIVEVKALESDGVRAIKVKPEWGHELDDGHVFGGVVADTGLGDGWFDPSTLSRGDHVVVTTDGFDRATRTRNPLTPEGETTALGREARVLTEQRWAEEMDAKREIEHEADLDRQRERSLDRGGHY